MTDPLFTIPFDNFVAIDFETTNHARSSVCSVGMVRVIDGTLDRRAGFLIVPPDGSTENLFTHIHGITNKMITLDGVHWASQAEPFIRSFAGDLPFLAHNAAFDRSAYRAACKVTGITPVANDWYCTLKTVRKAPLPCGNRLNELADHFRIPLDHHEAGSDALAAALIALNLQRVNHMQIERMKP